MFFNLDHMGDKMVFRPAFLRSSTYTDIKTVELVDEHKRHSPLCSFPNIPATRLLPIFFPNAILPRDGYRLRSSGLFGHRWYPNVSDDGFDGA